MYVGAYVGGARAAAAAAAAGSEQSRPCQPRSQRQKRPVHRPWAEQPLKHWLLSAISHPSPEYPAWQMHAGCPAGRSAAGTQPEEPPAAQ